jgi:uncharacterized protein
MNILIDAGHPAHVHLFRNFAQCMIGKGHSILFTCRDKEFEEYLLKKYDLDFISFGRKYNSAPGKLFGLFKFGYNELLTGKKFKADIFLSHGSIYAAHASFLLRKPHISFEDTFNFEQIRLYSPFTDVILVSDYENPLMKRKNVVLYPGYHELAYLHPKLFSPDEAVLSDLGVRKGEKYVILRFVSWKATHDTGQSGITLENKIKTAEEFSRYAKVFISSEKELPEDLKKFRINIPPEKMHDAIAFSSLVFGESATMASEAAMLGVPSVFIDDTGRLYTKELEQKYNLVFNFTSSPGDQILAIKKGNELLQENTGEWKKNRDKMLSEKLNVTSFLVWFIENYPASLKKMKDDPSIINTFK